MNELKFLQNPKVIRMKGEAKKLWETQGRSYVLMRIPKTASATLANSIFDATYYHLEPEFCETGRVEPQPGSLWWDHFSAQFYIDLLGTDAWDKTFSLAVVRNPWARLYSIWKYSWCVWHAADELQREKHPDDAAVACLSFEDWLMGGCHHPSYSKPHQKIVFPQNPVLSQRNWLVDDTDTIAVDLILRLEELDKVGVPVLKKLFGTRFEMEQKINQTSEPDEYMTHYKPHMIEYVSNMCSKDIETFRYTFDGLLDPGLVFTNDKKSSRI